MKKVTIACLAFIFCLSLFYCGEAAAGRKHITEFFDDERVIETYVSAIKNSSGDKSVDVKKLKKTVEGALEARRSHDLNIVSSESAADITVDVEVVEYYWTDHDPVDMVFSPIAAAADAAIQDNYARMAIDVTVTKVKNGRKLWSEKVQSTITDGSMTKKASYDMSAERVVKNFIKELFKKPRRR